MRTQVDIVRVDVDTTNFILSRVPQYERRRAPDDDIPVRHTVIMELAGNLQYLNDGATMVMVGNVQITNLDAIITRTLMAWVILVLIVMLVLPGLLLPIVGVALLITLAAVPVRLGLRRWMLVRAVRALY